MHTNLYLSKAACQHFRIEVLQDFSPETAYSHWFMHIFELDGKKHLIVIEEKSLYTLVKFAVTNDLTTCIASLAAQLDIQMQHDKFSAADMDFACGYFMDAATAYPTPYNGREMTIISANIRKLRSVFEETQNPTAVKIFARLHFNDTPWKALGFETPRQAWKKQIDR